MADARRFMGRIYRNAFGTDNARQLALSPTEHTARPNAPDWLILYVASRHDSRAQSVGLGERLRAAGANVRVEAMQGTNHGELNRGLGTERSPATPVVQAYLRELLGR
jgi:acetyl esterase/lipase